MLDEIPVIAPRLPVTPAVEMQSPLGESLLPAPTTEQTAVADRVFTDAKPPHPLAALLVVPPALGVLRDIVADTLNTAEEEDDKQRQKESLDS
jgi:hypothetical protein